MTSPITSTSGTTAVTTATTDSSAGGLTADSFMKVLAAQLSNQDPLASGSGTDSMAQMTQLGILTSLQTLAASQKQAADDASIGRAMDLIGHTVTYAKADGTTATGVVGHVSVAGHQVTLTIGDATGISPSAVQDVSS